MGQPPNIYLKKNLMGSDPLTKFLSPIQKWTVAYATAHIIDDRNRSLNYFFCTYFLISREIATKITIPIAMY